MSTLLRLLVLTAAPRRRVALAAALGTVTVLCGVGLMATAGYLISRAAERPAVLSLTVAIVCVRVFGLGRPVARYLERLASHDLAFRALAGVACDGLRAHRAAGTGTARGLPRRRSAVAPWWPTWTRSRTCTCAASAPCWSPRSRRSIGGRRRGHPAAAAPYWPAGCLPAASPCPGVEALAGRGGSRQAEARGELTAELVELLRGGPSWSSTAARRSAWPASGQPTRGWRGLARRAALADGHRRRPAPGGDRRDRRRRVGCGRAGARCGHLDRVMIAVLTLLALAAFEAVQPLPAAARELSETLAAGRRVLDLIDQEPAVTDPPRPAPPPDGPYDIALEGVAPLRAVCGTGARPAAAPRAGRRVALLGASGAGKTTVAEPPDPLRRPRAGTGDARRAATCASTARRTCGGPSPSPARTRTCSRPASTRTSARRARRRRRAGGGALRRARARRLGGVTARRPRHAGRRGRPRAVRRPAPAASSSPARCSQMRPCSCSTSRRRTSTRPPPRP